MIITRVLLDFPADSDGKEAACNAGDPGLIPGLGISPGVSILKTKSASADEGRQKQEGKKRNGQRISVSHTPGRPDSSAPFSSGCETEARLNECTGQSGSHRRGRILPRCDQTRWEQVLGFHTGGLTLFRPLSGLQKIPVATREESGVLCFPSTRGLTPWVSLECKPEIPVALGHPIPLG